jgi:hypothetical protein
MSNFLKKYLIGCFILFAIVMLMGPINNYILNHPVEKMTASVFDPDTLPLDAKPASGFAWNDNVGWINFGDDNSDPTGRVYVSDNKLYGYAWGENIGWISMTCENDTECTNEYGVSQDPDRSGVLTGYAWGENIGWIDFAPTGGGVYISTSTSGTNTFSGYAWGENIGWVSFSDTDPEDSVTTTWVYPTSYIFDYNASTGGVVNGSSTQTLLAGEDGTEVVASSGINYHFVDWSDGILTAARTDTSASSSISVTANFAINTYTFSYISGENGTITGSSTQTVAHGSSGSTATGTPNSGYHFVDWSDGVLTAARTDTNASSSISVTANFERNSGSASTPSCVYNDPVWSICNSEGVRTGTSTATNQTCIGEDPKIEEAACTPPLIATSTATSTIGIIITPPATTTIFIGDQIQFAATVTGTTSTGVFWDITNLPITGDNYYGTINDDTGLYTSPVDIRELTFLNISIRAKSKADPDKTASITITVRARLTCTGYTYSNWSLCLNETQSREKLTSIPFGCSGGIIASTTQSCSMATTTATTTPCTNYTYSAWGDCINNSQNRQALTSIPDNCIGGDKPITEKACTVIPLLVEPDQNPDATQGVDNQNNVSGGTNHSTAGSNNSVPDILNVSNFVLENITVLGTTTEKIILGAKKILESPAGAAVAQTVTTVGVVGGGIAASSVFAMNGTVATDLLFLPFKIWGLLLSALGIKKRNRPWGTVYDSVTKQPLDPAYVTLKQLDGKEENTSITDLDGRYGFLVAPGKYILTANKTNYTFPSKNLLGKTEDVLYGNLYFGEEINTLVAGAVISKNIPLDPIKFDWNEFVKGNKKLMKFYSKREKIIRILTDWVFRIGFIISLISLFLVSAPYNLIIFGLYLVLTVVRKFGLKQKTSGSLTDKDGNPLSFAIVRVFASDLNVEITNKVADKIGKYYCLVNKGKYYVKIEKKNDDQSYSLVYTSPVFDAQNGIINESFVI